MKKIILIFMAIFLAAHAYSQSARRRVMSPEVTKLKAIENTKEVEREIKRLRKGLEERDLQILYEYYLNTEGQERKADETKLLALKKFPNGNFSLMDRLKTIELAETLQEKDSIYQALYKQYPKSNFGLAPYNMALLFAVDGNEEKMLQYQDLLFKGVDQDSNSTFNKPSVQFMLVNFLAGKNPKAALSHVKKAIEQIKVNFDTANTSHKESKEAEKRLFDANALYAGLLIRTGNLEDGYKMSDSLYQETSRSYREIENRFNRTSNLYLEAALDSKRYREALPLIEKAIREGKANERTHKSLKDAYAAVHGDIGFEEYRKELYAAEEEKLMSSIKAKMIKEPSPDFSVRDFDGNTVKLSDFRGKIVFLDFWATWCGPCKASFPAMQAAVDYFQKDKDIVFLFIHTFERGQKDPVQEAKSYINDNNYRFNVLMDIKNSSTGTNDAAKGYGITAIPTKIVIDPDGNIRFKNTGSSLDKEANIKELSRMFELIRK